MADDGQALLLQISADVSRLQKQMQAAVDAVNGGSDKMEKRAQESAGNIERFFGDIDIDKALGNVFSRSRFAVIEEGSAKLSVFGAALEDLGPAGLVAAAGLGALGVGLEEAHKALDYADGLYKTAAAANLSTDALQKYQVALSAAGGDASQAGAAVTSFSSKLGEAQEGLKRGQQGFLALGFTPAQINGFKDTDSALQAVTDRIGELSSKAQQNAVIQQLGLDGLKPLVLSSATARDAFLEASQDPGQTLSQDVIAKAHDLNDQYETLTRTIKNDLTSAFVDLGPVLVKLTGLAVEFLDKTKEIVAAVSSDKFGTSLKLAGDVGPFSGIGGLKALPRDADRAAAAQRGDSLAPSGPVNLTTAQLLAAEAPPAQPGNRQAKDLSAQPKDDSAQRQAEADAALDRQNKDLASANAALTSAIQAHADFEKAAVDAQRDQLLDQINKAEAAVIADKGISDAKKQQLLSEYELAKGVADQVDAAKKALIDRQAQSAIDAQILADTKSARDAQVAALNLSKAQSPTASGQNAIANQILRIQQDQAQQEYAKSLGDQVTSGALTQDQADTRFGNFVSGQKSVAALQVFNQADPIEKYTRSVQDLNTEFASAGVTAAKGLADGLAQSIVEAKNLGEVAQSVFAKLAEQLISDILQKTVTAPLIKGAESIFGQIGIPGFASGTDSAPGGLALVGERGPELVNLARGSQVIPNSILQGLNAGSLYRPSSGVVIHMPLSIDATGADPAQLMRVQAQINQLPSTIRAVVNDGIQRRTIQAGR